MFRARRALKEFRAAVVREFAFLATDFGFAEEQVRRPANEFSVWFVNTTTRVMVEGIHWGGSARVAFGSAGPRERFENFDLLDLVSIRCPGRSADASLTGQLEQLEALAVLLRDCGAEVLRGDFSVAPQLLEVRRRRVDEWERQEAERGRPRPPLPGSQR